MRGGFAGYCVGTELLGNFARDSGISIGEDGWVGVGGDRGFIRPLRVTEQLCCWCCGLCLHMAGLGAGALSGGEGAPHPAVLQFRSGQWGLALPSICLHLDYLRGHSGGCWVFGLRVFPMIGLFPQELLVLGGWGGVRDPAHMSLGSGL